MNIWSNIVGVALFGAVMMILALSLLVGGAAWALTFPSKMKGKR